MKNFVKNQQGEPRVEHLKRCSIPVDLDGKVIDLSLAYTDHLYTRDLDKSSIFVNTIDSVKHQAGILAESAQGTTSVFKAHARNNSFPTAQASHAQTQSEPSETEQAFLAKSALAQQQAMLGVSTAQIDLAQDPLAQQLLVPAETSFNLVNKLKQELNHSYQELWQAQILLDQVNVSLVANGLLHADDVALLTEQADNLAQQLLDLTQYNKNLTSSQGKNLATLSRLYQRVQAQVHAHAQKPVPGEVQVDAKTPYPEPATAASQLGQADFNVKSESLSSQGQPQPAQRATDAGSFLAPKVQTQPSNSLSIASLSSTSLSSTSLSSTSLASAASVTASQPTANETLAQKTKQLIERANDQLSKKVSGRLAGLASNPTQSQLLAARNEAQKHKELIEASINALPLELRNQSSPQGAVLVCLRIELDKRILYLQHCLSLLGLPPAAGVLEQAQRDLELKIKEHILVQAEHETLRKIPGISQQLVKKSAERLSSYIRERSRLKTRLTLLESGRVLPPEYQQGYRENWTSVETAAASSAERASAESGEALLNSVNADAVVLTSLLGDKPSGATTVQLSSERMQASTEAGIEAGTEAGIEAGTEAGIEAGTEAGIEAGTEAGIEAVKELGSEPTKEPAQEPATASPGLRADQLSHPLLTLVQMRPAGEQMCLSKVKHTQQELHQATKEFKDISDKGTSDLRYQQRLMLKCKLEVELEYWQRRYKLLERQPTTDVYEILRRSSEDARFEYRVWQVSHEYLIKLDTTTKEERDGSREHLKYLELQNLVYLYCFKRAELFGIVQLPNPGYFELLANELYQLIKGLESDYEQGLTKPSTVPSCQNPAVAAGSNLWPVQATVASQASIQTASAESALGLSQPLGAGQELGSGQVLAAAQALGPSQALDSATTKSLSHLGSQIPYCLLQDAEYREQSAYLDKLTSCLSLEVTVTRRDVGMAINVAKRVKNAIGILYKHATDDYRQQLEILEEISQFRDFQHDVILELKRVSENHGRWAESRLVNAILKIRAQLKTCQQLHERLARLDFETNSDLASALAETEVSAGKAGVACSASSDSLPVSETKAPQALLTQVEPQANQAQGDNAEFANTEFASAEFANAEFASEEEAHKHLDEQLTEAQTGDLGQAEQTTEQQANQQTKLDQAQTQRRFALKLFTAKDVKAQYNLLQFTVRFCRALELADACFFNYEHGHEVPDLGYVVFKGLHLAISKLFSVASNITQEARLIRSKLDNYLQKFSQIIDKNKKRKFDAEAKASCEEEFDFDFVCYWLATVSFDDIALMLQIVKTNSINIVPFGPEQVMFDFEEDQEKVALNELKIILLFLYYGTASVPPSLFYDASQYKAECQEIPDFDTLKQRAEAEGLNHYLLLDMSLDPEKYIDAEDFDCEDWDEEDWDKADEAESDYAEAPDETEPETESETESKTESELTDESELEQDESELDDQADDSEYADEDDADDEVDQDDDSEYAEADDSEYDEAEFDEQDFDEEDLEDNDDSELAEEVDVVATEYKRKVQEIIDLIEDNPGAFEDLNQLLKIIQQEFPLKDSSAYRQELDILLKLELYALLVESESCADIYLTFEQQEILRRTLSGFEGMTRSPLQCCLQEVAAGDFETATQVVDDYIAHFVSLHMIAEGERILFHVTKEFLDKEALNDLKNLRLEHLYKLPAVRAQAAVFFFETVKELSQEPVKAQMFKRALDTSEAFNYIVFPHTRNTRFLLRVVSLIDQVVNLQQAMQKQNYDLVQQALDKFDQEFNQLDNNQKKSLQNLFSQCRSKSTKSGGIQAPWNLEKKVKDLPATLHKLFKVPEHFLTASTKQDEPAHEQAQAKLQQSQALLELQQVQAQPEQLQPQAAKATAGAPIGADEKTPQQAEVPKETEVEVDLEPEVDAQAKAQVETEAQLEVAATAEAQTETKAEAKVEANATPVASVVDANPAPTTSQFLASFQSQANQQVTDKLFAEIRRDGAIARKLLSSAKSNKFRTQAESASSKTSDKSEAKATGKLVANCARGNFALLEPEQKRTFCPLRWLSSFSVPYLIQTAINDDLTVYQVATKGDEKFRGFFKLTIHSGLEFAVWFCIIGTYSKPELQVITAHYRTPRKESGAKPTTFKKLLKRLV